MALINSCNKRKRYLHWIRIIILFGIITEDILFVCVRVKCYNCVRVNYYKRISYLSFWQFCYNIFA